MLLLMHVGCIVYMKKRKKKKVWTLFFSKIVVNMQHVLAMCAQKYFSKLTYSCTELILKWLVC